MRAVYECRAAFFTAYFFELKDSVVLYKYFYISIIEIIEDLV